MTLEPWTPFERGTADVTQVREQLADNAYVQQIAREFGSTPEVVRQTIAGVLEEEMWLNSRYQVNVRRHQAVDGGPDLVHLSIKRRDKQPIGSEHYRDFMRIKDELLGAEYEGVELYPARSREVDTATQYHLWLIDDPTYRFPFGFRDGRRVLDSAINSKVGANQNAFEEHHVR